MAVTRDLAVIWGEVPGSQTQLQGWPIAKDASLYVGTVALKAGSGTGATDAEGYLRTADSPHAFDQVVGIVMGEAGGTFAFGVRPIVGDGVTDGTVVVNVQPGVVRFKSATGADTCDEGTNGATVYYGGTSGATGAFSAVPIACATSNSSARPVLGTQLPFSPGDEAGYVFVRIGE